MHWLRNKKVFETEAEKALREEFNLKIVYPEEMFYRTHKISQQDLLDKLRQASDTEREKILLELFSDKPISGRRGVATLKKSNKILKEKIKSKERLQKLASKYTEEYMTGKQIRESGLFRNDMLY